MLESDDSNENVEKKEWGNLLTTVSQVRTACISDLKIIIPRARTPTTGARE